MSLTFIDTNKLPRLKHPKSGEYTEILNKDLCGAENVVTTLHWLSDGQSLDLQDSHETHQLYYVMDGEGTIRLNEKDFRVRKGSGIYLGPLEQATFRQTGSSSVKLFHLTVPTISN